MKDIIICSIIIILIYISETYFPQNALLEILIITIGALYFGNRIYNFIKKHLKS